MHCSCPIQGKEDGSTGGVEKGVGGCSEYCVNLNEGFGREEGVGATYWRSPACRRIKFSLQSRKAFRDES